MKYCKACGNPIEEGDRFCDKCSSRLDKPDSVIDIYDIAATKTTSDFNPDAYIISHDLTGCRIMEYRITEKILSQFCSTYYTASKTIDDSVDNATIQHIILPTDDDYDQLLYNNIMDKVKADALSKKCVENIQKEIAEYVEAARRIAINNMYRSVKVTYSSVHNVYHIFLIMKPVIPLYAYIKTKKLTVRDIIKIGINISSMLIKMQKHGVVYQCVSDCNVYFDDSDNVYLGCRLNYIFESTFIHTALTSYNKIFEAPDFSLGKETGTDIYSLGILMHKLLNNLKHPYINYYNDSFTYHDYIRAEQNRMKKASAQLPFYAQNMAGKAITRTFSIFDDHDIDLEEFKRIMENSLNYISSAELNTIVFDFVTKEQIG